MSAASAPRAWPAWLAPHCSFMPLVVMPAAVLLVGHPALWLLPALLVALAVGDELCAAAEQGPPPLPAAWGDAWLALFALSLPVYVAAALATASRSGTDWLQWSALTLVGGLLFSVTYNLAHDLIHRADRPLHWGTGYLLLMMVGDAQLSLSHVISHHVHVATPDDPASARRGETLPRFVVRSTLGQYRAAWAFEVGRLARLTHGSGGGWGWRNKVALGVAGTLLLHAAVYAAAGWRAQLSLLTASLIGKFLFESANYIQHYGLSRQPGAAVLPVHSWDCHAPFTRLFMLNQNHHAHHHLRAGLRCWELGPQPHAARMPHGYITMMALAACPPLWFRTMDPRLDTLAQAAGPAACAHALLSSDGA